MLFSRRLYLILGGLNSLCGVLCALYPTQPYSKTVFASGRYESIVWIDDGKYPRIQDLGNLNIELYNARGGFIATLARFVQPHWYGIQVQIPGDLRNDGLYYLRFNGQGLREGVFTAYFTIREDEGNHQNPSWGVASEPVWNSLTTTSTSVEDYPVKSLLNMDQSTSLSSISDSTSSSSSILTTSTFCSTLTRTLLPTSTVTAGPLDRGSPGRISSNALAFSRTGGMNRDKFKFVFIVWPALIGISMAF